MAGRIYVASVTFRSKINGRIMRRGVTTVREGHPILAHDPGFFRPFVVSYDVAEVPTPVAVTVAEPVIVIEPEPDPVPEPEAEPETEAEPEPEVVAEAEPEPETRPRRLYRRRSG